ncbi:MAG: hypothetical protein ACFB5Z_07900 [Elainellaceae cyanobacterium]
MLTSLGLMGCTLLLVSCTVLDVELFRSSNPGNPPPTGTVGDFRPDNLETGDEIDGLSGTLRDRILAQAETDLSVPASAIQIRSAQQQTWPNGCLALPQPDELCSMAIVEGWRIEVSAEGAAATYRTDNSGQQIRRER